MQDNHYNKITIVKKFSMRFFDFEKSQKDALKYYKNFCLANKDLDENVLKYLASEKLINAYAKKTSNIGFILCFFSAIPFIQLLFSLCNIPFELIILTRYNMHLMVKLAVINDYPLDDDDFVDTIIKSAKHHDLGGTILKFFLRLIGLIPFIGQIISIVIGGFTCAFINKKETLKFGNNILKEYNVNYKINTAETTFDTFIKITPWIINVILILFICFLLKK